MSPIGSTPADGTLKTATQRLDGPAEQPEMKSVLPLLNTTKEKLRSTASANAKSDSLALAEAAFDTLKKTPGDGRYRGHRVKAMDKLKEAIAELKTGDRANKAGGYLSKTIMEVNVCLGLAK